MGSDELKQIQLGGEDRRITVALSQGASMRTESGSVYCVVQDTEGRWFLNADNVPNPASRRLDPDSWWRIEQPHPWPPELGAPIALISALDLDRRDAERMPGGGKVTSPVRLIRNLDQNGGQ